MDITTLLRFFGVSMKRGNRRDFVNQTDMNAIYRDVRQNYREQMKKCHPDTGGSEEQAMQVNKQWARLERWYRRNCPSAFYVAALAAALILGLIAQAEDVARPWIRQVYQSGSVVTVEFSGPSITDVLQVERNQNGLRDKRMLISLFALERFQMSGQPEVYRWRDTNDIVLNTTYTYRVRIATGSEKGPWSREIEINTR